MTGTGSIPPADRDGEFPVAGDGQVDFAVQESTEVGGDSGSGLCRMLGVEPFLLLGMLALMRQGSRRK